MEEIQGNNWRTDISGLEKTFIEYKRKLETAEQEAEEIRSRAWRDAEEILNDARQEAEAVVNNKHREARQIIADTNERAKKEADNILANAKNRVSDIEKEVNDKARREMDGVILSARKKADEIEKLANEKAKKEAKEKVRREIEKIEKDLANKRLVAEKQSSELIEQAKDKAEEIVKGAKETARSEAKEQSKIIISEATEKARKIDEDSATRAGEADALIVQVCQKCDDIYNMVKSKVKADLAGFSVEINRMIDNIELKTALEKPESGNENSDNVKHSELEGRRELNIIQPFDRVQVKQLREVIKNIPNIRIEGESGTEENYSIFIAISESTPLLDILGRLSLVESSSIKGNTIELKLKESSGVHFELSQIS